MKFSADFREIARRALKGKWWIAALTALAAWLIGAQGRTSSSITEQLETVAQTGGYRVLIVGLTVFNVAFVVRAILSFVIGGAGQLGYVRFHLHLVDGKPAQLEDLFSQFHRIGDGFIMQLLLTVYTVLWTLLFIIPGIVKSYSYAMTPYILSEHPEYNPNYAISLSREMMDGNKYRLFCLEFSFIGWAFLAATPSAIAVSAVSAFRSLAFLPLILISVVAELFLMAYRDTAKAAFYREISDTEQYGWANATATETSEEE